MKFINMIKQIAADALSFVELGYMAKKHENHKVHNDGCFYCCLYRRIEEEQCAPRPPHLVVLRPIVKTKGDLN